MRKTEVLLQISGTDTLQPFEAQHAYRILQYPNSGWELPANSKYELTSNGIKLKPNKENTNRTKQDASNTSSKKS